MRAIVSQYPGIRPHKTISVWALATVKASLRALIVGAAGIQPIALKISAERFWLVKNQDSLSK